MNVDLKNLKMTDEELERLDWCRRMLDEEQIVEVEDEALEIAEREVNAPIAAEELRELLVTVLVRNASQKRSAEASGK
jgi:NifB/MoaA-like Fe-S oxidoreductase